MSNTYKQPILDFEVDAHLVFQATPPVHPVVILSFLSDSNCRAQQSRPFHDAMGGTFQPTSAHSQPIPRRDEDRENHDLNPEEPAEIAVKHREREQ